MGLQIRDERQMKALTGLSQAPFDSLLPVFSDIYRATQQQTYEEGLQSGTRRRRPGGGSKGKLPTLVEKLQFVLYSYKTYPTFDVLGTPFAMARSKANENLHKLSPILYDTLVHRERMPYREWATPEDWQAALQGVDRLLIDATARAYHRSADDAKQREPYRGKKTAYAEAYSHVAPEQVYRRVIQFSTESLTRCISGVIQRFDPREGSPSKARPHTSQNACMELRQWYHRHVR